MYGMCALYRIFLARFASLPALRRLEPAVFRARQVNGLAFVLFALASFDRRLVMGTGNIAAMLPDTAKGSFAGSIEPSADRLHKHPHYRICSTVQPPSKPSRTGRRGRPGS
jgi:hypothetical protein